MIDYCNKNFKFSLEHAKALHSINPDEIFDWTPASYRSVILTLSDGFVKLCTDDTNSALVIYNPNESVEYEDRLEKLYSHDYLDEKTWQPRFARKLGNVMDRKGYTKVFISDMTDISRMALNKYGRYGKDLDGDYEFATPTLYNATKIATSLRVPLSELYITTEPVIDIYKIKTREEWNDIIGELKNEYPRICDNTIEWYPVNNNEIVVHLRDNTHFAIDCDDFSKTIIYDPTMEFKHHFEGRYIDRWEDYSLEFMAESEWRLKFSDILRELMYKRRISQKRMKEEIGVTQAMLSRYMNGYATPNLYIATKMSKVLECSLTKFHII